jgi:indole-3-glycerol phosphate synthase
MSDFKEVIKLINSIQDKQLLEDFLMGLTTEEERKKLTQRIQIIKRLLAGEPQHSIAHDLGVGIATVTRGSKELRNDRFKVLKSKDTKSNKTKLDEIIAAKKRRLQEKKQRVPYSQLEKEAHSIRPFQGPTLFEAIKSGTEKPRIIAEVKKASPSRGIIRNNFSLKEINSAYQTSSHVIAISILTEEDYFQGSEEIFSFFAANNTHNKPLLRKDFIFDSYQVLESKVLGAQAYLLIAALFKDDTNKLRELIDLGYKIGIEPLVEVHNREELELVKSTKARIVGVNCRDMETFTTDPSLHELLKELDNTYAKVAESGIRSPEHLSRVSVFSDAALIGGRFMSRPNIEKAITDIAQTISISNKDEAKS